MNVRGYRITPTVTRPGDRWKFHTCPRCGIEHSSPTYEMCSDCRFVLNYDPRKPL